VGILISKSLQYTVIQELKDDNNNILVLRLNVCGTEIILAGIYGPNSNDKKFFSDLNNFLERFNDKFIICAGDWNATYCTQDGPENIDIINMPNPPSLLRSLWLAEICEQYNLSDPYRMLHYNKKEFTFVPRAGTNNRSRLDFFLISDKLLSICNKCSISDSLQTELFDHKSINLAFCRKKNISKHNINPSILNHRRFEAVVAVAVTETYLHHADPHQPDVDVGEGLLHVGRLITKIMQCNEVEFKLAFDGENEADRNNLKLLQEELDHMVLTLPEPARLNEISLICDPDIFLEVLMGNIRNSVLSFQAWVQKIKNARANFLIGNLNRLKIHYNDNIDCIAGMEAELTRLRDEDLSSTLREIKIFEHLHNEKPSPLFLTLIRNRNLENLQCIRKEDGSLLSTEEDREKYIREFFEDIYTNKNTSSQINYDNCISDFLGNEIINHPVVQNSRLTVQEREMLDLPLTVAELDESINNCNLRSAAGADGYSNKLIKKCWHFFRLPLFNYANHCYSTGMMTANFRSACIKLIPKKGDTSRLKNWRPISLLSNMYKIISRAINARLKKIVDRICSRAQKGYNSNRYVQEVLINVCETIAHCKSENVRGAVLAVDMAKAFDSLDHKFIKSVYKFFGLGDGITAWLDLLGNNRQASIILSDTHNSKPFKLGTGRAQGDNLSPNIFNFCEQILIFKLELDPRLQKIPRQPALWINPGDGVYSAESCRETDINESLADDNTVLSVINKNSLLTLRDILQDFASFSGLHCNFDKTSLLPIFPPTVQELDWIREAGFTVVNKIKLLGADITSDVAALTENFDRIYDKMVSTANYWSRFKLSLPGRIAIAKTFLISQLNYLGCVFRPTDEQLARMQSVADNFVKKNLNISKSRLYLPPDKGGLGFFNLNSFLESQRCTWLFRAKKKCIDNWRYDITVKAPHNDPLLIRSSDIDALVNPIIYHICTAYDKFYESFCKTDHNFRDAYIYDNTVFRDTVTNSTLGRNFFGIDFYNIHKNIIRNLKFSDCFSDLGYKTMQEFVQMGLPLNMATWMRLRNSLIRARHDIPATNRKSSITVHDLVNRWRKGGKKIRSFIERQEVDLKTSRAYETQVRLLGTDPDPETNLGSWTALWNTSSLTNDFRMFIYNSRYNSLKLNNRLNAYLPEIDPGCTFCYITNNRPVERDSMLHCFLNCPTVRKLLYSLLGIIGRDDDIDTDGFRKLYWYGKNTSIITLTQQIAYNLIFDSFRYILFRNRQKKLVADVDNFIYNLVKHLYWICYTNKKLKLAIINTVTGSMLAQALG
jgi:hypothetical protein